MNNDMKDVIKKQPIWHSLISIAILIFAVYFICKISINVFSHPYAVNECREAADVQLTQAFLEGDNPYLLESLDKNRESGMPPVLYQYSFLNSALGAVIALLVGGDARVALYLLAILSMIGSGMLVYLMIRRNVNNTTFPILGATLSLFCNWRFGYLSTTPNSLGIFLMLFTAFVATSEKINGRRKLILTAIFSVLCFYSKLYYVTVAFGIFVFFFVCKKSEAWKYFAYCIGLGATSVLIIQLIWPLYFTYNIYFVNGMGLWFVPQTIKFGVTTKQIMAGALAMSVRINLGVFSYVFEQYGYMIVTFVGLFLVLAFSLITAVIKRRRVNVQPNDTLSLMIILTITQGLCLMIIGKADGAYLSYFLQLWMPFVIIASMICADRYVLNNFIFNDRNEKYKKMQSLMGVGFVALFAFVSVYLAYHKLPLHIMTEQEIGNWQIANDYIDNYGADKTYYAPELAFSAIMNDVRAYDNGHTAAASEKGLNNWKNEELSQKIFKYAGDIAIENIEYQKVVIEHIKNHEYGLVTLDEYGFLGDRDFYLLLEDYGYIKIDTLPLAVGNATYDIQFWALPEGEENT